ncbi:GNAT family N-acetyltransferase [Pontibacillus salicampi]|uniref:GNAT family N-acetyltransferase n=1 Tax=Pontibacillus salicampi TaxID=1449801 RepID=A0ABV6LIK1_9BACI
MIRTMTHRDHIQAMELLHMKPSENLFIIGDIEAYGYEQEFQTLWGDYAPDGTLRGVLLKYEQNFIPYAPDWFDAEGFAHILNNDPNFRILSGLDGITSQVKPFVKRNPDKSRLLYYAKCDSKDSLQLASIDANIEKATVTDIDSILHLHSEIEEFASSTTKEEMKRNMENGLTRTYYIKDDGIIVSSVSTAAENSQSAMIIGVCTLPSYKRQGLATQSMTKLCYDMLEEGKELCLFYDNPSAGNIYKRIGFRDIDKWAMHTYE